MFERYDTPVRCSAGHLYTTIWMPLASLKSVRLGNTRLQRCPVGHHWATVKRIDGTSASLEDLTAAASVHDARIP